jgi:hypothetical protein
MVQRGGSEPKYAAIAMMSSSDNFATDSFIVAALAPALEPFRIPISCRAI